MKRFRLLEVRSMRWGHRDGDRIGHQHLKSVTNIDVDAKLNLP